VSLNILLQLQEGCSAEQVWLDSTALDLDSTVPDSKALGTEALLWETLVLGALFEAVPVEERLCKKQSSRT